MFRVARSISIASPNILDMKRIAFPSCDQSARSPKVVSRVMWGGRWSAGLSPALKGCADEHSTETAVATNKEEMFNHGWTRMDTDAEHAVEGRGSSVEDGLFPFAVDTRHSTLDSFKSSVSIRGYSCAIDSNFQGRR